MSAIKLSAISVEQKVTTEISLLFESPKNLNAAYEKWMCVATCEAAHGGVASSQQHVSRWGKEL